MFIEGELIDQKCVVHNVDKEEHAGNDMADWHLPSASYNSCDKETINYYGEDHKNREKDDPDQA